MAKPPPERDDKPMPRLGGARPVRALLPDVGGVAFRKFGFQQGALVARWAEVVGAVYARWSVPESIRCPRGQKIGGLLTIRVEGPFAVQLQHVAPQIIERANRIFGYAAVERIRLVQGEVPRPAERPAVRPRPTAPPATNLAGVKDDGLRAALEALAREVEADARPPSDLPKVR